jgi:formylmethanofuran:tetrahydromethanopterin formyltransferase
MKKHSRVVNRLKRIVTENGKFPYGSASRCLDVVEHLLESHRRMCINLQECVQRHKIGLGGEYIDEVVIRALDAAKKEEAARKDQP